MINVRFINREGIAQSATGDAGQSVMEVAKRNGIEGIIGECGGSCACATCHVYVAAEWRDKVGTCSADETGMLEFVSDARPESRLSCQIRLREELDGLTVSIPEAQR